MRTIIFSPASVFGAWEPELPVFKSEKAIVTKGCEGPSMTESIVGCEASLARLAFVVSLPLVFVRRDVKVSGMPEKRVPSLWRDEDFCIGLRGMGGAGGGGRDVSNLKLICNIIWH